MHESSLALSILDIVVDQASKARAPSVHQVDLCIGELAGVETTTLADCFDMLSQGTIADSAKLVIERVPATGTCTLCGAKASRKGRVLCCPMCKTTSVRLATGRELYVKSIEVENPHRSDGHYAQSV